MAIVISRAGLGRQERRGGVVVEGPRARFGFLALVRHRLPGAGRQNALPDHLSLGIDAGGRGLAQHVQIKRFAFERR
ncbi:hypothetical protein [Sphingomonas sp. Ant20]|uniref:hypothetical protein n=1 Tax=Sphingomonas sp. Ant20 TaxID=104605 RepID=UPI000536F79F|nr:hypothetical protein [Sphingomonas sp. Ant20]KHA65312.1 hypothetical protein NI18_03285 [Sphingomonas sp. Ant20]